MRLVLDFPGVVEERKTDNVVVLTLTHEPGLEIEISALTAAPIDRADWIRRVLTLGVIDPASVRVLGSTRTQTHDGWGCEIVDVIIVGSGSTNEHRLIAMYEMLAHVASVTMRTSDAVRYHDRRESLLSILLSARPSWRSRTPIAIAELWSLETSPSSD